MLAISSDCAAIWNNLPKTPEQHVLAQRNKLVSHFPRLLQVGVVSRKYGTPYLGKLNDHIFIYGKHWAIYCNTIDLAGWIPESVNERERLKVSVVM